jgi:secondary thiamine-phosphate synthase enzyme
LLTFSVATSDREQVVDLTERVQAALGELGAGEGVALVSVPHCTCAVYLNEHESGLLEDTLTALSSLGRMQRWRHDIIDDNAAAHLGATLLGNSVLVPVKNGRLELGTWQRVLLVELDGPRTRRVMVTVLVEVRPQERA